MRGTKNVVFGTRYKSLGASIKWQNIADNVMITLQKLLGHMAGLGIFDGTFILDNKQCSYKGIF